jgi:hypothetical protein
MTHAPSSLLISITSNSQPPALHINGVFDSSGGLGRLMVTVVLNCHCGE